MHKPMHLGRLRPLADLLLADLEKPSGIHFSMDTWARRDVPWPQPQLSCGTTCCAGGFAALSGKFPGLTLRNDGWDFRPKYGRHSGLSALQHYFNLTKLQATYLFLPSSYILLNREGPITQLIVIRRIKNLCFTNGIIVADSHHPTFNAGDIIE